jgi:hypothetical protein
MNAPRYRIVTDEWLANARALAERRAERRARWQRRGIVALVLLGLVIVSGCLAQLLWWSQHGITIYAR